MRQRSQHSSLRPSKLELSQEQDMSLRAEQCWKEEHDNDHAEKQTDNIILPLASPVHVPLDDHRFNGFDVALFSSNPEYTEPMVCDVIGNMPEWVQGTFIRVGPGQFEWGTTEAGHLFDGDAIAHKFNINDGKVMYSSKFLDTGYHRKNKKYNRFSQPGFGTWAPPDPCANIFLRMALYFIPNVNLDNTNVNVFTVQEKTYVATELPWMLEIDRDTLETIKEFNARESLATTLGTWSPHPHFDRDGTTWAWSTRKFPTSTYQLIKIPPASGDKPLHGLQVVASLNAGPHGDGYYHSFCLTDNYVVLVVNPLFVEGLCSILTMNLCGKAMADIFQYKPEIGTSFRIVDKHTGEELRECRAEGMCFFHTSNAYETNDHIIIDVSTYQDDSLIKHFYLKNCRNLFRGQTLTEANLVRYRIPKSEVLKKDVEPYQLPILPEQGHDFEILGYMEGPVYNYPMVNGKDYTYCYGVTGFCLQAKLAKINVKTKECLTWEPENENILPTFPNFFGRPGGTEEDDGVLVTTCTGANGEHSFFLVLDARTMKEVCRANMPVNMGMMLHGNFFPSDG